MYDKYVRNELGNKRLVDVKYSTIKKFYNSLLENGFDFTLKPGQTIKIPTGIRVKIDDGLTIREQQELIIILESVVWYTAGLAKSIRLISIIMEGVFIQKSGTLLKKQFGADIALRTTLVYQL